MSSLFDCFFKILLIAAGERTVTLKWPDESIVLYLPSIMKLSLRLEVVVLSAAGLSIN